MNFIFRQHTARSPHPYLSFIIVCMQLVRRLFRGATALLRLSESYTTTTPLHSHLSFSSLRVRGMSKWDMSSFYDLTAKRLNGSEFKFSDLKGKVVLVENTATLWGTTVRDFTQMNELCEKYGDKLVIILFVQSQILLVSLDFSSGQWTLNSAIVWSIP